MSSTVRTPRCWLHEAVEVRSSGIEGHGLFTRHALPAGAVVARLRGRLVTSAELARLLAASREDPSRPYVDCITVSRDQHLVMAPGQPIHFGNHSCDPNLWHADAYTLVARRPIVAQEELTVDYATHTADPGFRIHCRCGTAHCRGIVTGDDWQLEDLQERYVDHWVPALLDRITQARSD